MIVPTITNMARGLHNFKSRASFTTNLMRQVDFARSPRFAQVSTFARLLLSKDLEDVRAVFVGIPFDGGTTYRAGARFGPSAIRQGSRLLRPYNPFTRSHPFEDLNACDYGDVDVVPTSVPKTMKKIEDEVGRIAGRSTIPFIAGGDHSITLPVLRAMSRRHGKVNLVHMDSHFDFWQSHWGERFTHGTWLRRAREEGLLNQVIQLGIRGSLPSQGDPGEGRKLSIKTFSILDMVDRKRAVERALSLEGPVYLSLDIDVADPSCAPGTGTPEVGGLSALELIRLVRSLQRLDLIGMDVVEVSPPYDVSELTSMLAANLLYEGMSVLSARRQAR
jgi:agmatinase